MAGTVTPAALPLHGRPLDLIVFMGVGIVPGHIDGSGGMVIDQRLQQVSNFTPPLMPSEEDDRLPGVVIDRANPVVFRRLTGGENAYLLAFGTPERFERRQPRDVELVRVVEGIARR